MDDIQPAKQNKTFYRIRKNYFAIFGRQFLMIMLSILSLYPVFFMIITSIKSKEEYVFNKFSIPKSLSWSNFYEVFVGKNFGQWFLNSIILTAGAVVLCLFLGILASFALSRYQFKIRDTILNFIVALMVIPPVIMVVPLFVFMARINMINSIAGVIMLYAGLTLPFSIYLLTTFFRSIPQAIIDSSSIDGCSSFRTLRSIILPLSMPPIITLIVVNSLWVWNELMIALIFLQKDELKTLMVGITVFKSRYSINIPLTMMGLLVITIPMVLLYLFGQKYFVQGLVSGSLKE
ncbi:MAG: carbohydrate ABC transporter permease [Candidatus Humimicrobiaceae bacterium]